MGAPKGHKKAGGRKKGTPNKTTTDLKQMILNSLSAVGGEKYLTLQAKKNPGPYMTLVGKVLPRDINANVEGGIKLELVSDFKDKDGN
jgi:hypothetical protein